MLTAILNTVRRPARAVRSDLSVAAYCMAFGAEPEADVSDDR